MLTDFMPVSDEIALPPLLIGGAHAYYRTARPLDSFTARFPDGGLLIRLSVQVIAYADEACTQPWPPAKWPRPVKVQTDELTAVDPATGTIRYIYKGMQQVLSLATFALETIPADLDWPAWLAAHPDPLTLQTHYYRRRYDAGAVDMRAEEAHHIQQAAAWGLLE
ncbi:hypothetical protein ACVWYF_004138 [Hymenobacter sp. UYAg731]